MSTMSVTELQKAIKDSVVTPMMEVGLSNIELIQVDNYKWIAVTEIEGEQRFAEIALTAKKADFTYEDAQAANVKFIEKYEKANTKGEVRNSSGNLSASSVDEKGEYVPYAERYANDDF